MAKQAPASAASPEAKSSLKTGVERFLSQLLDHALDNGFRTADDFVRHFGPLELMQSLEEAPHLRKDILVAAGVHERVALKKSVDAAAEDLRMALDEGVTTPREVLELLPPDDRVRHLDRSKLFNFIVGDGFHAPQQTGFEYERAVERMVFVLEAAIGEELMSVNDVIAGIGFDTVARRLPPKELQKLVEHALVLGSRGEPLSNEVFLEVIPLRTLVGYVPLEQIWTKVVLPKLGLSGSGDRTESRVAPAASNTRENASREAITREAEPVREAPRRGPAPSREPPPKPASATNGKRAAAPPEPRRPEPAPADSEVDNLLDNAEARPAAEEEARTKVVDRLRVINRLPPRHGELTTPILLSIDSMYAELLNASTDEDREEAIRDSFPNEQHMTLALLALIELLDPSIDVADPVIRDADLDSLVKVVLFEERHRYEQAHPVQSQRSPAQSQRGPAQSQRSPAPSQRSPAPPAPPLPPTAAAMPSVMPAPPLPSLAAPAPPSARARTTTSAPPPLPNPGLQSPPPPPPPLGRRMTPPPLPRNANPAPPPLPPIDKLR